MFVAFPCRSNAAHACYDARGLATPVAAVWDAQYPRFLRERLGRKNSKQIQNARNESWEKEREPKREVRGDADELTETRVHVGT